VELKNKIAIVTGASRGIGKSISIALAKKGAVVVLVARNLEKLKQTGEEIKSFTGRSLIIPADLADEKQIMDMFAQVKKEFGRLDIVINNAAVTKTGKLIDFCCSDYDKIMNINLKAVYLCCQQALYTEYFKQCRLKRLS